MFNIQKFLRLLCALHCIEYGAIMINKNKVCNISTLYLHYNSILLTLLKSWKVVIPAGGLGKLNAINICFKCFAVSLSPYEK